MFGTHVSNQSHSGYMWALGAAGVGGALAAAWTDVLPKVKSQVMEQVHHLHEHCPCCAEARKTKRKGTKHKKAKACKA